MIRGMLFKENTSPTWNNKSIVFAHGIGRQPAAYAVSLQALLQKIDPETADACLWHSVAYDDVNTAIEEKVIQFNGALQKEGANALASLGGDFVVDLVNFLFAVDPYHWITNITRKAFTDVIAEGQKRGVHQREHEIYILSHSLGTVVAYETLHAVVNDAQALGRSSGFQIQTLFTLGSPIAFIKANQSRIPSVNAAFALRNGPIDRPQHENTFLKRSETNINEWINLRQKFDPVASVTPLDVKASHGAVDQDLVFDAFHTGSNPHDFANYLTEYGAFIMESIRG